MKNWIVLLMVLVSAFYVNSAYAIAAQIGGQANGYSCHANDANRWKIETGNVATLPDGYTF